jgi:hypothetical protein
LNDPVQIQRARKILGDNIPPPTGMKKVKVSDLNPQLQKSIRSVQRPSPNELKQQSKGSFLYLIFPKLPSDQVEDLISCYRSYLSYLQITYCIILVEQISGRFNPLSLMDSMILHLRPRTDRDYVCYHPINYRPTHGTNFYCPKEKTITLLCGQKDRWEASIWLIRCSDYSTRDMCKVDYSFYTPDDLLTAFKQIDLGPRELDMESKIPMELISSDYSDDLSIGLIRMKPFS